MRHLPAFDTSNGRDSWPSPEIGLVTGRLRGNKFAVDVSTKKWTVSRLRGDTEQAGGCMVFMRQAELPRVGRTGL